MKLFISQSFKYFKKSLFSNDFPHFESWEFLESFIKFLLIGVRKGVQIGVEIRNAAVLGLLCWGGIFYSLQSILYCIKKGAINEGL